METTLKFYRKIINQRYNELGIFKSDVKLNPSTLVDDLEMSTRLKRFLKKHHILNVEDVSELRTFELINMEGIGPKTIVEFDRFRYKYQLGHIYTE